MRLRHIEVIQAILQTGSITAAANLLHISQPAVSKTLQHAEQQLGFELFLRTKGRLLPTPEAHILQREFDLLGDDLQRIRDLAANLRHQENHPLRLVCTPTLAQQLLPMSVSQWRTYFPNKICYLATHHTDGIKRALLLRECDLGFSLQPSDHPGIYSEPLAQGCLQVITPKNWELGAEGVIDLADLAGQRMIGLELKDPIGALLSSQLERLTPPVEVFTRVQTYQLQLSMVASGEGIAIVDPFTAFSARHLGLTSHPLTPNIAITLHGWWLKDQNFLEPQRRLLAKVKEAARELLHCSSQPS
jgi:DNA-binding transcriptional LysR family regulator